MCGLGRTGKARSERALPGRGQCVPGLRVERSLVAQDLKGQRGHTSFDSCRVRGGQTVRRVPEPELCGHLKGFSCHAKCNGKKVSVEGLLSQGMTQSNLHLKIAL